jgi:nucleoside-diphosphate-sugar epimerase
MDSDFVGPVNIGSEEMIAIQDFANMAIDISGKKLTIKNIDGPTGVRGRNSDNDLIRRMLDWDYKQSLREGMEKTYHWISEQVNKKETL